jgi:hypothetical protein
MRSSLAISVLCFCLYLHNARVARRKFQYFQSKLRWEIRKEMKTLYRILYQVSFSGYCR